VRTLVLLLTAALAGCETPPSEIAPTDSSVADVRDSAEAARDTRNCHLDCFGGSRYCKDGVVETRASGVQPCNWTLCPVVSTYPCARGCRLDGMPPGASTETAPQLFCEELRPKKLGDPCTSAVDCTPVSATTSDAGVTHLYLRCDADAGVCVEGEAPSIPDYLGDCGLAMVKVPAGETRVLSAPSCSGKLCLARGHEGCVAVGCTLPCIGDDQCPRGSLCAPTSLPDEPPEGICVPIAVADVLRCSTPADAATGG
jgi:hypothetical protein